MLARLGLLPRRTGLGPADPRRGVDDDSVRRNRPGLDQRAQHEVGGGRIAARGGHPPGPPDRIAEELRKAVSEALDQLGPRVRLAIPALIIGRAVEAEVRAEVDERHTGREQVVRQRLAMLDASRPFMESVTLTLPYLQWRRKYHNCQMWCLPWRRTCVQRRNSYH